MVNWILKKIIGSKNQREIRRMLPSVEKINQIELGYQSLSDDELRAKTAEWKERVSKIEDFDAQMQELDVIMPEVFAAVKNTARRLTERQHSFNVSGLPVTWNMVHFDVQLIGGMVLHSGRISEMATGEGKTLVATCPVFLNALTGRGVHVVTVNDYLARRDAEWMSQIYCFLGLSCAAIQHDDSPATRRMKYQADITYGTNSEFGFDYLRDNGMATNLEQQVQRGHYFAIVDEVDSILIDEARTPLIIAGPATVSTHQYDKFKPLVEQLVRKQTMLCNRLISDAEKAFTDGKIEDGGLLMFKVKLGQPRNKGLFRLMEDPEKRKIMDKVELSFYGDTKKDELFALKEELFFTIDEKAQDSALSDVGREFLNPDEPDAFVLPDLITEFAEIDLNKETPAAEREAARQKLQQNYDFQSERIHNISQLLRAYCLFEKDVEYVVEENKVVIVDENTGRKMPGRRWSDGLHQAVEAKENVQIDRETQTLATITIQNYFRLYQKLAGMTGTAETEATELHDIYRLDVIVIPTNRKVQRKDFNDKIYKTRREKYNAVIAEIKEAHGRQQPVLVGTVSVEASELVSRMLKREKITHTILNAKFHAQEAEIITRAGIAGAVTISTNMAGRGTDIKLGPGVTELGGLHVIGTERHQSRRVDRQLRGRCARQGDPGSSRFYVSFEDDLMRNFGAADRMTSIMERFGLADGEELEHPWLNRSVETAQKRVEQRDYLQRKRTLDFDDVMNKQREVVYGFRNDAIENDDPRKLIFETIDEAIPTKVLEHLDVKDGDPNYGALLHWCNTTFPLGLTPETSKFETRTIEENSKFLVDRVKAAYTSKAAHEDALALTSLERYILLNAIDRLWQEHLYGMDALREGIYLRQYGQKDALVEYKNEAYEMFVELMGNIRGEILGNLFRSTTNLMAFEKFLANLPTLMTHHDAADEAAKASDTASPTLALDLTSRREAPKVGRNDPCPCGSGKKYKACCGRNA